MPHFSKFPLPKPTLPKKPSSLFSSVASSIPTHEEISHLILQQKTPSQALQTFKWASTIPSFTHNPSTTHSLIQPLISFKHLQKAEQILLSSRSPPESSIIALIRAMGRARRPNSTILNLLDTLFPPQTKPPPLTILNAVLDVLVRDNIDSARRFFRAKMSSRGDEHTFGILMKGLCGANRIAEAFKYLQILKRSSQQKPNPVIYNTLLHGLCRMGQVGRARSLMSEMKEFSCVTFNIMISAYCAENNLVQALVMLEKCFECGFVPDKIAVTKIADVLCGQGRAMEAVGVLERVESKGGVVDVVGYNCLVRGFCRMGKAEVGRRLLKEMERKGCLPNVQTYNVLVSGFCDSLKMDSAMDMFREMENVGISPDFETFDALIKGFCLDGRVGDGLRILSLMDEVIRGGDKAKISPYNSILYGYYKGNRLEEAYEFLERMERFFPRAVGRSLRILRFCKEGEVGEAKIVYDQMVKEGDVPSVLVYVSLIERLSAGGNVREAFDLMNVMVERRYFPVVSTFNALIRGFCKEGNLISATKLLDEMVSRDCSPNVGSYSPLISCLCRQKDVARAYSFLAQMVERGIVPDHYTWSCLLSNEKFSVAIESSVSIVDALCNRCADEEMTSEERFLDP